MFDSVYTFGLYLLLNILNEVFYSAICKNNNNNNKQLGSVYLLGYIFCSAVFSF